MRKTLLSLTALAGLLTAGIATSVAAAPLRVEAAPVAAPLVQPVVYYNDWRAREWRHREWERRRHWEWVHHHHYYHHGW